MSLSAWLSSRPFNGPLGFALVFAISSLQTIRANDADDGAVIPRVYDIRDLIESPADPTEGPAMSDDIRAALRELGYLRAEDAPPRAATPSPTGGDGKAGNAAATFGHAEVIADALRGLLGPSATAPRSVSVTSGGFLICTADAAQHQQIEQFLQRLRGSRRTLIHISARLIDVGNSVKLPDGIEEGPFLFGSDRASVKKALESLLSVEGVEVVSAPELVVFPLQRANVSIIRQVSYIAGYQSYRNVLPGGVDVAVPEIQTVTDGLIIDCQAIPIGDAAISLDLKVTSSDLVEPVPSEETPNGPIALPVVNVRTIQSKIVIPPGGAAMLPAASVGDSRMYFIVQIERVVPESADGETPAGADGTRRARSGG